MKTYAEMLTALSGKTQKERAQVKANEIHALNYRGTFTVGRFDVEVVDVTVTERGVQVFARAFRDGVQLGFGADGSVDIERFRFLNPPVLVKDPQGDIVQTTVDEMTGETLTRRYSYDPARAMKQALIRTMKQVAKQGTTIKVGKIGNTTSTFYSGSGDGTVTKGAATWAGARDASTGSAITGDADRYLFGDSDSGSSYTVSRAFFPIDTSGIPDTDTISSATFTVEGSNAGEGNRSVGLIQTSQTSPTALDTDDYVAMTIDSPTEGATRVTCDTVGDETFTLNASGIGWISKTGYTYLGLRMAYDIDNTAPSAGVRNYWKIYQSEQTGTTSDPVLVVEHAAGGGGGTFVPHVSFIM